MARPLRVEYAGACYHVINRGNYRRELFTGKGAAEAFERTLGEAAERYRWRVHAYVVMSNHFHLAIELTEPNLSEGMKWLQGTWIRRYNGYRRLIGRPFQGRYKALIIEPGEVFAQVCHYIHLNPVRARLCPADQVVKYSWSSLPKLAGRKRPGWLDGTTVLSGAGALADSPAGWKKYLQYLEFVATDETAKKELIAEKMSRGWCLGGPKFRERVREDLRGMGADVARYSGLEPDQLRAERNADWEERLGALANAGKIDLKNLSKAKSAPDKVLLAAAMKASTSVSNGWLAERLKMGQPASASQFARRLMLRPDGRRSVEGILSKVRS